MMLCPDCGGELRVITTFTCARDAQTRDYACLKCKRKTTSVTFLIDADERVRGKNGGGGAISAAKAVRAGKLRLENDG